MTKSIATTGATPAFLLSRYVAGAAGLIRTTLIMIRVISRMSLSLIVWKLRNVPTPNADINAIDVMELFRSLGDNKLVVIDARSLDEFSSPRGHIKNAINLPLPSLAERVDELSAYRQRKVVVVCLSYKRSTQAISFLRDVGFEKLALLRSGMKAWTANHLPVAVG